MILVIDKSKRNAESLAEMLHYTGYITTGATPQEALSEISTLYRAVIIISPERLPDAREFNERIRSYVSNIPIFAVSDTEINPEDGFNGCFSKRELSSTIPTKITEYTEAIGLPAPGRYTLAGIDASADLATPTYFWTPLPLTKTETAILRALIRAYPLPFDSVKILKYAYRQSRLPEASNVRTHVSGINKKFKEITGRALVALIPGEGYAILTPELATAE